MRTFHYSLTHKADEAYMAKMCHRGWAVVRLVEGVWTFAPCKPDQYVFRVCYLRGKGRAETQALKRALAADGITFVSRYSLWAIFRSEHDFQLYTPEGELAVCKAIRRPMPAGSALGFLALLAFLYLTAAVSAWFCIRAVLCGIYAAMCTALLLSYTRLIHSLREARQ